MIANLNYVHILVATLAYFFLGALWYSLLFQKAWMNALGIVKTNSDAEKEQMKKEMPKLFALTFVINFVLTAATACVVYFVQPINSMGAIKVGLLCGVGFVGASTALNNMYAKRPFKLSLIDAGYNTVGMTLAATILTLWH